jgi:hypothetical protein
VSIRIVSREEGLSAEFVCDWCEEQIEDAGLGMVSFVKPTWESYFLHAVDCLPSFERDRNAGEERGHGGWPAHGMTAKYRGCGDVFSLDLESFLIALVCQNSASLEVKWDRTSRRERMMTMLEKGSLHAP